MKNNAYDKVADQLTVILEDAQKPGADFVRLASEADGVKYGLFFEDVGIVDKAILSVKSCLGTRKINDQDRVLNAYADISRVRITANIWDTTDDQAK